MPATLFIFILLYICSQICYADLPGGDTVVVAATSYEYSYTYELQRDPRAIIEVEIEVPAPPPSCFTQDHNASKPLLILYIQEEISNENGPSDWIGVGKPWYIRLYQGKSINTIHEWDFYDTPTYDSNSLLRLTIATTCDSPMPVRFELMQMTIVGRYQVIIAAVILIGVYVLIITEVVHRTLAAMLGALVVLVVLTFLRERPPIAEVIAWIDEETIGLLLGMMIIIGIFSTTGFFEWMAVRAFKASKGRVWRLVGILCTLTAFLSAFLDNVTTMLLVAPVTLKLASVIHLPPEPFLMAEVFFCNIGGAATLIGDPPNIILGSVLSDYIGFIDFIINLAPACILAAPFCFLVVRFLFRKDLEDRPCSESTIADLEKQYPIKERKLFIKTSVVLSGVILMFFMEHFTEVEPAWSALGGAAVLLLVASSHEIDEFLHKVEWSTLLFFAGLFILVEGLKLMGLIRFIGNTLADLIALADEKNRLFIAILLILWVSGFASAFIDNIPYTTTMIPIIVQLAEDTELKLPLLPLAWALSFAACLGGNGTLVGASANVVTCGIAGQAGFPISFVRFTKAGTPVLVMSMIVVTGYMWLVYVKLEWGWGPKLGEGGDSSSSGELW